MLPSATRSSRTADIIGACLMVASHVAHAAPPADADIGLAPWFHSLTIPNTGSSCCGAADCCNYPVVAVSDGYRVQFRGQWLKVPPSVVAGSWGQSHRGLRDVHHRRR